MNEKKPRRNTRFLCAIWHIKQSVKPDLLPNVIKKGIILAYDK